MRVDARDAVRELLADLELDRRGYVRGHALQAHYESFLQGRRLSPLFWSTLALEMWLRRYWRGWPG
jgi:hypothetical protein